MWPVSLSYDGGSYTSETNGFAEWDWNGNEPLNKRLGRFVSIVELSKIYNMTFVSEPPHDMRLQFQRRTAAGDNTEFIIIKLHYPRPNSIRVQNKGVTIKPMILKANGAEGPLDNTTCGANKYFYDNYTIHFVLTGAADCRPRISLTNNIQLTMKFEMSIDDFFNIGGETIFIDRMAAALGIQDQSRIKVVGVYNGSVDVDAVIEGAGTSEEDSEGQDNEAEAAEMAAMYQAVQQTLADETWNENLTSSGLGRLLSYSANLYVIPS